MFKSYLKIALRNVLKQKSYSLINTFGLAIGMTSCLLIFLYVADEFSYDRFHQQANSIYRMNWDYKNNTSEGVGPGTPPPLAAALKRELPEVKAAIRLYPVSDMIVRYEDKFFNEQNIVAADTDFFDFFSFTLIEGNPETALDKPNSVILTKETALKYFGDESAMGEILTIGHDNKKFWGTYSETFKVTGVVENIPRNSHFRFDFLTSISSHPQVAFFDWSWIWMQVATYVIIDDRAVLPELEAKITDIVAKHAPAAFTRVGFSYDELIEGGGRWNFVFQPLTDIHLGSTDIGNRLGSVGNKTYVSMFAVVAVFILFIACINFINLATARSANRATEVGIRKVLGSVKKNLIGQFLTESVIFSFLAMLIALGLTELLLNGFNQISGKMLDLNLLQPVWLLPFLILLTLFVGVIAGSYPALYLSKFQPVQVLKGKLAAGTKSQGLRNTLVVFQFAISIGLIICTFVVHKQMQFMREADTGFTKEGVLVISNENQRLGTHAETFRDKIKTNPEVINATLSTGLPPYGRFQDYYKLTREGKEQFELTSYITDDNFLATLDIEVVEGRSFSKEFNESQNVILNERAVEQFGLDNPIGKRIFYPSSGEYEIVGVIKDFNFLTLQQPIFPFALFHHSSNSYTISNSYVAVRLQADNLETTLNKIKNDWQALAPASPFEYSFLDENFEAQYQAEQRMGTLFLLFAGLAVFIACLGLFGLASFTAEKRTKEIGIRKVLGASVPNLLFMLSREFTRWVVVANLIAWPVAFYFMKDWLENFAYKTVITWDIFLLAGGVALVISILTVTFQAARAALANPVEALRYE
ncbi:ABC transporter permease [candidate division KSB1 bacterium]|nr:ABC transporter permease [candidate division KSB1 bacterium]